MNLGELLERTLPPMGYELVDWESSPKGRHVRVFIDKPKGVSVEEVVIPDDIHDFLLWRSWRTVTTASGEFLERRLMARPAGSSPR